MAYSDVTAESIQRNMQEIRKDLRKNVNEVVSGANELLDWKSYVRRYPWMVMGAAAAVGYMLVPRRSKELEAATATQESLNNLVNEVHSQTRPPVASSSVLGLVTPILGGILIRAGTMYGATLMTQLLDSLNEKPSTGEPVHTSSNEDRVPNGNGRSGIESGRERK